MELDKGRLWRRMERLSEFTDQGRPWTRRAFTDQYSYARDWLRGEMEQAGLATRMDAGGNLIGALKGTSPNIGVLASGSHIDTVLNGGRYDGILGVVAALEVVQTVAESGKAPLHTLEVIDFLSEEPSDFGVSCVGSRAMSGQLSDAMLELKNASGERLRDAIRSAGGDPDQLGSAIRKPGELSGFIELHIEQGRVLENAGTDIGVVTNIVGIKRYEIVVKGRTDHSGTTPMHLRQDALVGASRIVDRIYAEASLKQSSMAYLVATVGKLSVLPGAANAVPGEVRMTVEVRSDQKEALDLFLGPIIDWVREEFHRTGNLAIEVVELSRKSPAHCSDEIARTIYDASKALGFSSVRMPSGAGHDAAYLGQICPTGMLFIPCLDGRSHSPEESITQEDAYKGARVLSASLMAIDCAIPSNTTLDQ